MDTYEMDMEKDPLFRGEFSVVKELLEKYPAMNTAKNQCDKLIDLNGPKSTGGTGIKQLRENIAESKLSYEIMDDAAQVSVNNPQSQDYYPFSGFSQVQDPGQHHQVLHVDSLHWIPQ